MSKRLNGEYMILTRNPNYHGPRPHQLDAIAFREGIDDETAVGRVESTAWDGVSIYGNNGVLATGSAVAKRFGPGSAAAGRGDERYHSTPERAVGYLLLNARNPAFRDARVRRAVAAALDRSSIADRFGLVPSADLLPPGLRMHVDAETTSARPLPGHVVPPGTVVVMAVPANCDACHQEAQIVRASLAPLGLDVQTKQVADVAMAISRRPTSFDIADGYTQLPYPTPPASSSRCSFATRQFHGCRPRPSQLFGGSRI
jgi:ABC-type transport system substrate-binding protein